MKRLDLNLIADSRRLRSMWLTLLFSGLMSMPSYAQTITITAVPLDRHGYNISCFGEKDGAIDITVVGGTPPYKYDWSNGSTNEDVQDLPAGFYAVLVTDAISQTARIEVILTEPDPLKPYIVPYEYPNGYNISCFNCYNGNLDLVPVGGATPYTYLWYDGPTTEDRSLLGSDNYGALVTDANGCTFKTEQVYLRAPDRSDWTMSGNAGTNPATQYLGTSDNKDAVLRTNNLERLRIKANGDVKFNSLMAAEARLVYADENGVLKRSGWGTDQQMSMIPWFLGGNNDVAPSLNRIGPTNAVDFILITDATERMRLTTQGRVGIGTNIPVDLLDIHHSDDRGGIRLTNDRADANAHSEIRFMKGGTGRFALGCDFAGNGGQDFFLWDQVAGLNRIRVDAAGRVLIGNATVTQDSPLYKLYVEGGIISRDVKVTANNFPDYVFDAGYALMTLDELRMYLHINRHLPAIPSASEVAKNGGVEVGDMQLRLLKTMEEQQLYILQLHDELDALKARLKKLESTK